MKPPRLGESKSGAFPAVNAEHPVRFRFQVTWTYVLTPVVQVQSSRTQRTTQSRRPAMVVAAQIPEATVPVATLMAATPAPAPAPAENLELVAAPAPAAPPKGKEAQWEMVIPKMARPFATRAPAPALAGPLANPAANPAAAAAPAPASPVAAAPAPASSGGNSAVPASFSLYTPESLTPRLMKMILAGLAVLAIAGMILLSRSKSGGGDSSAQSRGGGWTRKTTHLTGAADTRELVIYDGSSDVENYKIEFAWAPDAYGLGLISRGQDSANYYGVHLKLLQAGALSEEHFTVVKGVEGSHSRKVVTISPGTIPIRIEGNGPIFTLYIQGSPVD